MATWKRPANRAPKGDVATKPKDAVKTSGKAFAFVLELVFASLRLSTPAALGVSRRPAISEARKVKFWPTQIYVVVGSDWIASAEDWLTQALPVGWCRRQAWS